MDFILSHVYELLAICTSVVYTPLATAPACNKDLFIS